MKKSATTDPAVLFRILAGALLFWLVVDRPASADDWPQWRGPARNGRWGEADLVRSFSHTQLPVKWRARISSGYSGPTVAEGRVLVSDRVADASRPVERVHCFDAMTGDKKWTFDYDCPYDDVGYPAGPRGSITLNEGNGYFLGATGHLHCFNIDTGAIAWHRDLRQEYRIRMPNWGIACSPLVYGRLLIVQIGGSDGACIVALDKYTGHEQWRALPDPASYASPIIIRQAAQDVLVCWTGARLTGLDPRTGHLHWDVPTPPKRFIRACAAPVWHDPYLLVSCFFNGTRLLRLSHEELAVETVWHRAGPSEQQTEALHTNIAEPFIRDGHIYGVDSYGQLRCLDLHDGHRIWENLEVIPQRRWSTMRFIRNTDRTWIFTDQGELIIARLSREGYEEIDRVKVIRPTKEQLRRRNGVCWAHPAFAYGHIFARNDEEIICCSLREEALQPQDSAR